MKIVDYFVFSSFSTILIDITCFFLIFYYNHRKEVYMPEKIIVPRPDYLINLERHNVAPDLIKIVTGVRRCGKSTILKMYQDKLRAKGIKEEQILAIDLEDFCNKPLLEKAPKHVDHYTNFLYCVKVYNKYFFVFQIFSICGKQKITLNL